MAWAIDVTTTDLGSSVSGAPVNVIAGGFGNGQVADWGDPLEPMSATGLPSDLASPAVWPLYLALGALVLAGLVLARQRKG